MKDIKRIVVLVALVIMTIPATAVYAAENLPAGFIALSPAKLLLVDAEAFCEQKGGKLPLINGGTTWNGKGKVPIDGFGETLGPWPSGLPGGHYWTGTKKNPSSSWLVNDIRSRTIDTSDVGSEGNRNRAVCVPK